VVEKHNADLMEIPWIAPETTLHCGPADVGTPLAEYLAICIDQLKEFALAYPRRT
jgi:hypothetical protein